MTSKSKADVARWRKGGELNPSAPSFNPGVLAAVAALKSDTERLPCRFFLLGTCKYGARCLFSHAVPKEATTFDKNSSEPNQLACVLERLTTVNLSPSKEITGSIISDSSMKDLDGALVSFGNGAQVANVKLASDFSAIQILGLPVSSSLQAIAGLLDGLGCSVNQSCIRMKTLEDGGLVAEVRVEDPKFAEVVMRRFAEDPNRDGKEGLLFKPIQGTIASATLANRLQMSSVTCSWYAASRVAWLQYRTSQSAFAAKDVLDAHSMILGRRMQCSVQHPPPWTKRNRIWSIQVGNLDVRTRQDDFYRILAGPHKPQKIVMGRPSHPLSESEAAKVIESLLKQRGSLESFRVHPIFGSVKLKATATFTSRDQAVEAVQSLHDTPIRDLNNSKIYINHLISVKYNVLTVIYDSINIDLVRLKEEIWQSGHIHMKSYPSADPTKPFTTLRIFGEDLKRMAEAKSALEKLLAGSTVMKGDNTLWDAYFLTPEALIYLKEQSNYHKLYIHRDTRKLQLLLYGGSTNEQVAAHKSLMKKVESLRSLTNTIVLTSELLLKAMKGGWRSIKDKFGDAAALNISNQPKTIVIRGSIRDFQEAHSLLLQSHIDLSAAATNQDDIDCSVCWTEATEPLKTNCGHIYCKECFKNQVVAAGDGQIPIHCNGAEGNCSHIFSLEELKEMLCHDAFEKLLKASFDVFIRTHPEEFQYCPTPDCSQIYRISTDGFVVLCQTCLTPICTTCNVINHDGMSCSEYKDLSSEGNKAFQKWKKDHDVRDCPKCKSPIEKAFGCNHMECMQCQAHICWFCMEVFNTGGQVYGHMQGEHGNIYS